MTPEERDTALKGLDTSRERLLRLLGTHTHEQLCYRPSSDRWSVADCAEHVIVVERYMLDALQRLVSEAPDLTKVSVWAGQDASLMKRLTGRANRLEASESVRPHGRWPIDQLASEFQATRARSQSFVSSLDGDLRRHIGRHPALGDIDAYQTILFIIGHCDRHCAQAEDITAAPGFP